MLSSEAIPGTDICPYEPDLGPKLAAKSGRRKEVCACRVKMQEGEGEEEHFSFNTAGLVPCLLDDAFS